MNAAAFNEQFKLHVKSLGPAASAALAAAAHDGEEQIIREQTARKGIAPGHMEAVDGVEGRRFEEVKPSGIIFAGFDYRAEIVAVAFAELKARSPVSSGRYISAHFCMLDGAGLAPLQVPTAEQLKNVSRITISNPEPYARKLEVAIKHDGAPFTVKPHIYESAMLAVRHNYGSVANIDFDFVDLEGAYALHRDNVAHGRRNTSRDRRAGSVIRYPAIIIDR